MQIEKNSWGTPKKGALFIEDTMLREIR